MLLNQIIQQVLLYDRPICTYNAIIPYIYYIILYIYYIIQYIYYHIINPELKLLVL